MEHQALDQKLIKGQALVEYSLILVFVALAVIVVLALLGPAIGNTYSNVVAGLGTEGSLPTATAVPTSVPTAVPTAVPTLSPTWLFCANEDFYCTFSGTKQVQYGDHGVYTEKTLTDGTWCTNLVFGDPLVGTKKHCWYR